MLLQRTLVRNAVAAWYVLVPIYWEHGVPRITMGIGDDDKI